MTIFLGSGCILGAGKNYQQEVEVTSNTFIALTLEFSQRPISANLKEQATCWNGAHPSRRSKMSQAAYLSVRCVNLSFARRHFDCGNLRSFLADCRPLLLFVFVLNFSVVPQMIALMFSKGKAHEQDSRGYFAFCRSCFHPSSIQCCHLQGSFRLLKFANFLGKSRVSSFTRVGFKIFGPRRPLRSIWKDDCLETVAMPFAGKCAHQEGQRYPVFWKCFSPSSVCEVASCRAFLGWFAEFPLWQACLLCKK